MISINLFQRANALLLKIKVYGILAIKIGRVFVCTCALFIVFPLHHGINPVRPQKSAVSSAELHRCALEFNNSRTLEGPHVYREGVSFRARAFGLNFLALYFAIRLACGTAHPRSRFVSTGSFGGYVDDSVDRRLRKVPRRGSIDLWRR